MRTIQVAALAVLVQLSAAAQSTSPSSPLQPPPEGHNAGSCAAIARSHRHFDSLVRLCEFALQYRKSLPNFICDQRTTSTPVDRYNRLLLPPTIVDEVVRYADGVERHSDVLIDGKPQPAVAFHGAAQLSSSREFGAEFLDLFRPPIAPEFRFRGRTQSSGVDALEYAFHLPQAKNLFWTISGERRTIHPELRGTIWLDSKSARLLSIEIIPVHLPKDFLFESASKRTDYAEVALGNNVTQLLPVRSETLGCVRPEQAKDGWPTPCIHNVLEFHGCHVFAGRARIIGIR